MVVQPLFLCLHPFSVSSHYFRQESRNEEILVVSNFDLCPAVGIQISLEYLVAVFTTVLYEIYFLFAKVSVLRF